MRRIVLTSGLVAGAILSAMMLIAFRFQDAIGFDRGAIVGYASMVLAFLMVFFGVRAFRERSPGGTISFGQGFTVGILIVAVATACYVTTWQFVYRRMAPDFMERYAEYALEQSRQAGKSEAELERQRQEMAEFAERYKNPLVNIAFTALEPLPVGLLFTLVSAGVLSRRRRDA